MACDLCHGASGCPECEPMTEDEFWETMRQGAGLDVTEANDMINIHIVGALYSGFDDALCEALQNNPRAVYWQKMLRNSLDKIVAAEIELFKVRPVAQDGDSNV